MDYNYMQIEAAKKLLRQKADGSNANIKARQNARQLLRAAATDLSNFAMKNATSKPAQYLFEEANNLLDICEIYDRDTP